MRLGKWFVLHLLVIILGILQSLAWSEQFIWLEGEKPTSSNVKFGTESDSSMSARLLHGESIKVIGTQRINAIINKSDPDYRHAHLD